jgi:hypothetical protein
LSIEALNGCWWYPTENFSLRIAVNLEGFHLKIFEKLNIGWKDHSKFVIIISIMRGGRELYALCGVPVQAQVVNLTTRGKCNT